MPELRPQLSAAMTSLQSPIVDKDGKPTLAFHRMLERVVAMIGNDEPFIALAQQELPSREIDELRAEIATLRAAADSAQDTAAQASGQIEDLLQEVSTISTQAEVSRIRGALSGLDVISPAEVKSGHGLVAVSDGAPTPSSKRMILDSTNAVIYLDDGVSLYRVSPEVLTGTAGGNLDISSTSFVVVAGVAFAYTAAAGRVSVSSAIAEYQSPNEASAATCDAQWAVYLADTLLAPGAALSGATTSVQAWAGATNGLQFILDGADFVVKPGFDDVGDAVMSATDGVDTFVGQFAGSLYVYLCLKVTSAGGEVVKLGGGSTISVVLGS